MSPVSDRLAKQFRCDLFGRVITTQSSLRAVITIPTKSTAEKSSLCTVRYRVIILPQGADDGCPEGVRGWYQDWWRTQDRPGMS